MHYGFRIQNNSSLKSKEGEKRKDLKQVLYCQKNLRKSQYSSINSLHSLN